VLNVTHQLESSLIQSLSNAKNARKVPNTVLTLKAVNVTVPPQDQSIQPPRLVNVWEEKSSLTINAYAQMINLFGTVKDVFLVQQEQLLSQKTNNVTIVHKDLLLIQ
jgi:hypothetical protein